MGITATPGVPGSSGNSGNNGGTGKKANKSIHKTVLVWRGAQAMFDLVRDVQAYPDFLPWCSKASILQHYEDGVEAEVEMSVSGLQHSFVTRNRHHAPHSIRMSLVRGPFSHLAGLWEFEPLTPVASPVSANLPGALPVGEGCRVRFSLEYAFSNALLALALEPVFNKIATSLVDAFVERAHKVYGGS